PSSEEMSREWHGELTLFVITALVQLIQEIGAPHRGRRRDETRRRWRVRLQRDHGVGGLGRGGRRRLLLLKQGARRLRVAVGRTHDALGLDPDHGKDLRTTDRTAIALTSKAVGAVLAQ